MVSMRSVEETITGLVKDIVADTIEKVKDGLDAHVDYRNLPPARKLEIIREMGFSPVQYPHTHDCPANVDPTGYICNCVREPTMWVPPQDVLTHTHETWEELRDESVRRTERQRRQ